MKVFEWMLNHRKTVLITVAILTVLCLIMKTGVGVDYDMMDYLPADSDSTKAIETMSEEFDGGIPNVRAMINDITIPEALKIKEKLENATGVTSVTWLDDVVDLNQPLEMQDTKTVENYYKDNKALYSIAVSDEKTNEGVEEIKKIIGKDGAVEGSAVNTAAGTQASAGEMSKIVKIIIPLVFLILILATTSWFEPVLFLLTIGIAIILNSGTNIVFGQVSFVTNTDGSVLQLAVSMDYSIFLLHRFAECRKEEKNVKKAMLMALKKSISSIASSGLTTVIGFVALMLMRFQIGPDMGRALAKGIVFSLISVLGILPVLAVSCYKLIDKTTHRSFIPSFGKFASVVLKSRYIGIILFLMVLIPSYLAQQNNQFDYGAADMFGKETEVGKQKDAIQEVFGKANTMVLLVPKGDTAREKELSDELHKIPEITSILSYVDVAGAEVPTTYVDEASLSKVISKNYSRFVLTLDADYEGDESFALVERVHKLGKKYYKDEYHLAGTSVSTYDLKNVVTEDNVRVNTIAIGAVLLILILTFRQLVLPFILIIVIETSIWINLSVPYFQNSHIFFIAYLIISSVQLGATVDYAILLANRYRENRLKLPKKEALLDTISSVSVSVMTSASILMLTGFSLGNVCTNQVLSKLGYMLGRGALLSMVLVLFVLPGLLYCFDKFMNRKSERSCELA